MRYTAVLLFVVCSAVVAHAEESWLGKPVFWKPGAKATVNGADVDIETLPFPSYVQEVNGDLLRLGKAWVRKSDVMSRPEAMEFLSGKIRDDGTNPYWWSKRGLVWQRVARGKDDDRPVSDNFPKAMQDHAEAIRLDPDNASYYYNRGLTFWDNNGWDGAIKDFTEAIKLDPKHVNAFRSRGLAWSYKREPDKAIADLTEVLRIEPNDEKAYYNRGQAWGMKIGLVYKAGQQDECRQKATNDYTQAIKLDPQFVAAYAARAYTWNKYNDLDQPIADMTECIKLQPKNFSYYEHRGYLQSSRGKHDEAIQDYSMAVKLRPNNSEAYHRRGDERRKTGDFDEAIKDFTEAIRIDLKSGEASKAGWGRYGTAYNSRGLAWLKKGEFEKALQDYQEAIRIAPADLRPLTNIAWLRATCPDDRLRNGKEAVELATKSLSSCRECSGFDTLAAAYAEVGDFPNAVKWAEKSIEAAPGDYKQPIIERLSLYRLSKPYREVPRKPMD